MDRRGEEKKCRSKKKLLLLLLPPTQSIKFILFIPKNKKPKSS
jgi:hypothetical protein